jgi:hypothetical protein
VSTDVAEFVWTEVQPYYGSGLAPDPSDRWQSTLRVDPLDLIDIADRLWRKQGWGEPDYRQYPVLDADTSLLEFARWLQVQQSDHAS